MVPLQVSFFGGHKLVYDVAEIPFSNRKVMALLAFLALESDQTHSRESLIGLLWPDLPEQKARNNLRVSLTRLRKRLAQAETAVFPLNTNRTGIRFQPNDTLFFDVAAFQALLRQCDLCDHTDRDTCTPCQSRLAEAAALYEGPLLHGFFLDDCPAFDEWLFVGRERLHLQMMELLEELAQGLMKNGRFAEATTYTRRQLELDPLHDSAQRRLLRLLAYQRQPSTALSQYQSFKTLLRQELGVAPDVELIQLAAQIESNRLPLPDDGLENRAKPTPPNNLPENLTPFLGRETELAQVGERLAAPAYRLITLAGPGGIGKTRLAIELARANLDHYADGAFFVPLAAVEQVENMVTAMADALNLHLKRSAESPQAQLIQYLRGKRILLLIDNLEHLIEGVDLLLDILRHCPHVVLLVTSRQRLDAQAEDLFRLRGLPAPDQGEDEMAGQFPAVRLFCDRAHRLKKSFKLTAENRAGVASICRLVEGLPLALELAASWIRDITVEEMVQVVGENVDLLRTTMRDVAPQHRSMCAVFAYSWGLLAPAEQQLLAKLSVFRGGFTPETAEIVAGASATALTRLRFQSLLRRAEHGRYDMHELTRQFAAEQLTMIGEGEEAAVYRQHSHTYAHLLASHAEALRGQAPHQTARLIQRDIDNIRQAWQWVVTNREWALLETAVIGQARFLAMTSRFREGVRLFRQALKQEELIMATHPALVADLQIELAYMLARLGQLEDALDLARMVAAWATGQEDSYRAARAYLEWGFAAQQAEGDGPQIIDLHQSGIVWAQRGDHRDLWAQHLRFLGYTQIQIDPSQSEASLKQALTMQQELGNVMEEQWLELQLGISRLGAYDYEAARSYLERSLALMPVVGNPGLESRVVNALGFTEAALGDFASALPRHERARRLAVDTGELIQESLVVGNLVTVNRKLGHLTLAEAHGEEGLALAKQADSEHAISFARLHLTYVWLDQKRPQQVVSLLADQLADLREVLSIWGETAAALGDAYRQLGQVATARDVISDLVPHLLDEAIFGGTDEPFQVYLNAYRILHDAGDDRAESLLRRANEHLQAIAARINHPERRRTFLENVPTHREMVCLMGDLSIR